MFNQVILPFPALTSSLICVWLLPPLASPIWLSLYRGYKKAADPVSWRFYFMEMLKGSLFHIDHTSKLAKYGVNWVLWNSKPLGPKAF